MSSEQVFGTEIVKKIKELVIMANQFTQEERMILANTLCAEAAKQHRDKVRITLLKLAEYIESMEVSQ